MLFHFRLPRMHKEGREASVCQPAGTSEHETMKLKRSITKPVSFVSKNENLTKTLPTASACKGVQHGFGAPPSSSLHGKVPKMTESVGVIKDMTSFHCNNSFRSGCKYIASSSAFLTQSTVSHKHSSFDFRCGLILLFLPKIADLLGF